MDGINKSHILWGIIVLLGYATLQNFWGVQVWQPTRDGFFFEILAVWSVLSIIGIALTVKWVPNWSKNKIVWCWIAVVVVGMLANWAFYAKLFESPVQPFYALSWFFVTAIGYAYTAVVWHMNKWAYWLGAVLNAIGLFAVLGGVALVSQNVFASLAIAGALPLFIVPFLKPKPVAAKK